jgi:FtsP/CotA-like multicopper oxidase with cupredoxin domain
MALTPEMKEIFASNHLTAYIGRPEDVAEVVALLASDRARFITGTTIEVDGGFLAHSPVYREMLTLNGQRHELNPVEKAEGYYRFFEAGRSMTDMVREWGAPRSSRASPTTSGAPSSATTP